MPTCQMCVLRIAGDLRKDHPTGSRAHGEFSENAIKCSFSFHLLNRHSAPHHPHPGQPPIRLFLNRLSTFLTLPTCWGLQWCSAFHPHTVWASFLCLPPSLYLCDCPINVHLLRYTENSVKGSGHSCPCGPCHLTGARPDAHSTFRRLQAQSDISLLPNVFHFPPTQLSCWSVLTQLTGSHSTVTYEILLPSYSGITCFQCEPLWLIRIQEEEKE